MNLSGLGKDSSMVYLMWFKFDNVYLIFECAKLKVQAVLTAWHSSVFRNIGDIFLSKTP